jgi:predicted RNA-binding Zn ribbon-like protein
MPDRSITINGNTWRVQPSGRITQYDRDEFGLVFVRGAGEAREMRVTRYSPQQTRSREASLAELTDEQLRELFAFSQPSTTSPEAGYRP